VPIWGTSPDAIDLAEDRRRFGALLVEEGIRQPENGTAMSVAEGMKVARQIGFPVLVRPSYVLGGRAMAICYDESTLSDYLRDAAEVSPGQPILLDRFLDDAFEVDLDLLADGKRAVVAGILQHIEEAGIHSGDSAAVLPPQKIAPADLDEMREIARRLALRLGVIGLMNVQFAIHQGQIYVIEVNPRASRTVPFIAKAVGVPLVKLAAKVMAGASLEELGFTQEPTVPAIFVKAPVFPFRRFAGVDPVLGPEMKSTGEVMGSSPLYGNAFAKAWIAAGHHLPLEGAAFLSVHDRDKETLVPVAQRLAELGFEILATAGTAAFLTGKGLQVRRVNKVHEGRPNLVDQLINRDIDLVINTPLGRESHEDDALIRQTALKYDIPCITTLSGALAAAEGIAALQEHGLNVASLQDIHSGRVAPV
jgi:carbamoyl-phosphate synthase large subunit